MLTVGWSGIEMLVHKNTIKGSSEDLGEGLPLSTDIIYYDLPGLRMFSDFLHSWWGFPVSWGDLISDLSPPGPSPLLCFPQSASYSFLLLNALWNRLCWIWVFTPYLYIIWHLEYSVSPSYAIGLDQRFFVWFVLLGEIINFALYTLFLEFERRDLDLGYLI